MASLFDSLTLVPVLSANFLKPKGHQRKQSFAGKMYQKAKPIFLTLDEHYQHILHLALSHRKTVVSGVVVVFMATMSFFALGLANVIPFIGTEFFPATDEGQFRVFVRLPVASAVEKTLAVVSLVENIIFEEVPEIKTLSTRAGSGGGMGGGRFSGPHVGNVQAMLVDQSERNRSSETIARTLRDKFKDIPGTFISVYTGGLVSRVMTFGSDDPIDVEIPGFDLHRNL
jgi:HAE1 family hydrophobic/amphiphilic exporter-1